MFRLKISGCLILIAAGALTVGAANPDKINVYSESAKGYVAVDMERKTDAEWRAILAPEVFRVARQNGTEPAFSGAYWNAHGSGIYQCAVCGNDLFSSTTQYNSGTGWPSFWQPIAMANISLMPDASGGMPGTEVRCSRCRSHLGYAYDDGPKPTGKRYSINSVILNFVGK